MNQDTFVKKHHQLTAAKCKVDLTEKGAEPSKLYTDCMDSHIDMQTRFGSKLFQTFDIDVPNYTRTLDTNIAYDYYNRICKIAPNYFRDFGMNHNHLTKPRVDLGLRRLRRINLDRKNQYKNKGDGSKFSKHLLQYAAKVNLSHKSKAELAKIVRELGELWSACETQKNTVYARISVVPYDFFVLGHFAIDNGSCFGTGAGNEFHKYRLAVSKNTFVYFLSHDKEAISGEHIDHTKPIVARAWGFVDSKRNLVHFCNKYPNHFDAGCFDYCTRYVASKILNHDYKETSVFLQKFNFDRTQVYQNASPNLTYGDKKTNIIESIPYKLEISPFFADFHLCGRCYCWKNAKTNSRLISHRRCDKCEGSY